MCVHIVVNCTLVLHTDTTELCRERKYRSEKLKAEEPFVLAEKLIHCERDLKVRRDKVRIEFLIPLFLED